MSLKIYIDNEIQAFRKKSAQGLLIGLQGCQTTKLLGFHDAYVFANLSIASVELVKINSTGNYSSLNYLYDFEEIERITLPTNIIIYDLESEQYILDPEVDLGFDLDECIYYLEFNNGLNTYKSEAFIVDARFEVPAPTVFFDMWSVSSISGYTHQFTIKGSTGKILHMNWGDGIKESFTLTGSDQIISHVYAAGTYLQKWGIDKLDVTAISANSQKLIGALPAELKGFVNLDRLEIGNNLLTGDLSTWSTDLSNWTNIQTLYLYSNNFTGDLSSWSTLSTWTNIVVFYIYSNNFTGDLSSWSALSTWTKIRLFRISGNSFTGNISGWSTLSTWTSILLFKIEYNSFSGDLSSWSTLSTWSSIGTFTINTNNFTGDLSSWSALSTWSIVTIFYLNANNFTGDLSSWSTLSTWSKILLFSIYDNNFTGDLSSWSTLSTWSKIEVFSIYSNNFTGINNLVNNPYFVSRIIYTASTVEINVNDTESLTGIYQQPDLGTYVGNINDLTEVEVNNLAIGTDSDGLGTNTVWSTLEKVWILELLEISSVNSAKRYRFEIIYL